MRDSIRRRLPGLGALGLGVLAASGQAPLGWWPLIVVGPMALTALAAEAPDGKAAFTRLWLFGLVFFGVVGQLDLDRDRGAAKRIVDIVRLGHLLLTRRLQGRPVVWVRRLSLIRRHPNDAGERVIARLLQLLATSAEAEDLPGLVGADD